MANEKRLIDANALMEQMLNHYQVRNPAQNATMDECCMMVFHAPTVDAVEVVRGEWAVILDDNCVEYAKCSVCGEEFYDPYEDTIDITFKYCPNCGADMRDGDGNV